jgi:hypothetical protein
MITVPGAQAHIGLHAHKTPTNPAQNTKLDSIFPASPVQVF